MPAQPYSAPSVVTVAATNGLRAQGPPDARYPRPSSRASLRRRFMSTQPVLAIRRLGVGSSLWVATTAPVANTAAAATTAPTPSNTIMRRASYFEEAVDDRALAAVAAHGAAACPVRRGRRDVRSGRRAARLRRRIAALHRLSVPAGGGVRLAAPRRRGDLDATGARAAGGG